MKLLPTGKSEFSRPKTATSGSLKQTSSPSTALRSSIAGASFSATRQIWRRRIDMAFSVGVGSDNIRWHHKYVDWRHISPIGWEFARAQGSSRAPVSDAARRLQFRFDRYLM